MKKNIAVQYLKMLKKALQTVSIYSKEREKVYNDTFSRSLLYYIVVS